jgi:hypothetical protein
VVVDRQLLHSGANESLGRKARDAATEFRDMGERNAAKLRSVQCNSAT